MKKALVLVLILALACVFMAACGGSGNGGGSAADNSIVGTWNYEDTEYGIASSYVLNEDGTGTYYIKAGDQEVTYELKYEFKDSHLLVTFVNNEVFTEDDVFDFEVTFQDPETIVVKDTASEEELTYIKQ